jgi:ribosome-binding factor A
VSQRLEKVQTLARQVLGEAVQKLKDPRVGFVTITAVRISADLQHARVFVSVMGSEAERDATMAGLRSATSYLRGELGRQVRLKHLPELTFELDRGPETAQRLEMLLDEIHAQSERRSVEEGR